MPSKLVSLRVDEGLWGAVGVRAAELSTTKTAVVEAALEQALGAQTKAPELSEPTEAAADGAANRPVRDAPGRPAPARASRRPVRADAATAYERMMRERQERMNKQAGR